LQPSPSIARGASAVSLSHVSLSFETDVQALVDVSLEVAPGERLCVLGPNGSGKSTLASVICGLLAPDAGSVTLVGEPVMREGTVDFAAYRRARRSLGLVFQNPDDQLVTTVVEEDVAFGPENLGVDPAQIGERVRRELHRVAMQDFAKADPTRLSGGQKQRVAIAGALAMEPSVIVFDEPGALLDVRGRRSIMRVMDALARDGITQVHVTHFMEEAFAADRVIVLDHGRIALSGTPDEVFSHERELRALGLEPPFAARLSELLRDRGVDVPWTCDVATLKSAVASVCAAPLDSRVSRPQAARATTGEKDAAPAAGAKAPAAPEDVAVSVEGVTFSYAESSATRGDAGTRGALEGVSLTVQRGSLTSIVGQTGSGKSTLARLMCALDTPDAGRIVVGGVDTQPRRNRRLVHQRIGYVMQHPERQLFAETVWQDVCYGPRNLGLDDAEVSRRASRALELVGLSGREQVSPFELSGGQQRLCAIAGILAMRPGAIVLDEPTAGLDPRGRAELRRILGSLHAHGVTIIQVTHSMEDAARSDQVVVLNNARLLMAGTPREVFTPANAVLLRECGLGLPAPLAWAIELREAGVTLDLSQGLAPLTTEALADALAEAIARAARGPHDAHDSHDRGGD